MLRILLTRAWLVALPFVAWFAWRAWARRSGREMGSTPWPWLFAAGVALVGASMMLSVGFHPDNRDEAYVPGEISAGGAVSPGRFVPDPAPK